MINKLKKKTELLQFSWVKISTERKNYPEGSQSANNSNYNWDEILKIQDNLLGGDFCFVLTLAKIGRSVLYCPVPTYITRAHNPNINAVKLLRCRYLKLVRNHGFFFSCLSSEK